MEVIKVKDYKALSKKAATIVAGQINIKNNLVLGLATGDTPLGMYRELVKFYKEDVIDFSNVITFNLDEYYGISGDNKQSYQYYMKENFFKKINIKSKNTHIPDGKTTNIAEECQRYDELIKKEGNIDLQVLGIGRNGHIGFNEPDVKFESGTHLVNLDDETISDNARFFENSAKVPQKAISMGIKNIMHAKKIILIANGLEKAEAVKNAVEGTISPKVPASILQLHQNVLFIVDEEAGSKLNN